MTIDYIRKVYVAELARLGQSDDAVQSTALLLDASMEAVRQALAEEDDHA